MKSTYQVVSVIGRTFVLGSEGISCVDHAVETICFDEVLGERFSRAFISDKINHLIPILLDASHEELQANTTDVLSC